MTCTFELCTLCMYALPKLVTVLENGSHYNKTILISSMLAAGIVQDMFVGEAIQDEGGEEETT